jgi:4-hydroxy-tetrahydrodipicolinate synthase
MHITGVVWTLPTPFRAGADVDHESLERLVDLALSIGVRSLGLLGPAGESERLTERERLAVAETVAVRTNGRAALIVDTTADGVRTCIDFSRQVKAIGASAVLVSPPRASRVGVEWIVNHYRQLAEAVDLPIVVQDSAALSGVSMDAGLVVRIGREVPAARTIKLDNVPTSMKIARILAAATETRIDVLGGHGGLFLVEDLMAGASGVASGFAYPEVLDRVVSEFRSGNEETATDVFHRFLPLMKFEGQDGVGVAVRKEMLRRRGVLADSSTRAPGIVLDEGMRAAIDRLLAWTARQPGNEWIEGA